MTTSYERLQKRLDDQEKLTAALTEALAKGTDPVALQQVLIKALEDREPNVADAIAATLIKARRTSLPLPGTGVAKGRKPATDHHDLTEKNRANRALLTGGEVQKSRSTLNTRSTNPGGGA